MIPCFLRVVTRGLLHMGLLVLPGPSRCPAGATAAPGERASAQVMSPHVALQGDTGRAGGGRSQPLHDGDSARGGTGGCLEAGGREGRVAFLSEGLGVASLPQSRLLLESGPCAPSVFCSRDDSGPAVAVAENLSAPAQLPGPPLLGPPHPESPPFSP